MVKISTELKQLKNHALELKIPIIEDASLKYITKTIIDRKFTTILELGTGIAYSTIFMALCNPKIKIVTIEKDPERYVEALKQIKKFELEDRITLICNDALNVKITEQFDMIFIDAAKSQYTKYFDRFEKNLKPKGIIFADNIKFHGMAEEDPEKIKSKNVRGIVKKIQEFVAYLGVHTKYKTEVLDIGDGLTMSVRR